MKPANEIEIKRNVYTFSAIVLVLSVLIGSSAWTLSNGRVIFVKKRLQTRTDSLEGQKSDLAQLQGDTSAQRIKADSLNIVIRDMSGKDEWRGQIQSIKGFLEGVQNTNSVEDLKTNVQFASVDETGMDKDVKALLNVTKGTLSKLANKWTKEVKDVTEKKSNVGGSQNAPDRKVETQPTDCSQCQQELAASQAMLKNAIKPILLEMQTELALLKGLKFSDNAKFEVGQYLELKNLTIPSSPEAAKVNRVLNAFKSVCNCIVNYPNDCAQEESKSLK